MTFIDKLSRLILAPPRTGLPALLWGINAIAIATVIRAAVNGYVIGLPFLTYFPCVMLAAIYLGSRYAAAVALASAILAEFLFMEPLFRLVFAPKSIFGIAVFLATSALMIGVVEAAREIIDNSLPPVRPDGLTAQVVFSLEGGQAWASWYGSHSWIRLGPEEDVAEMMEDFLAQRELGKRFGSRA